MSHASAIGVHNTKNDHVNSVTRLLFLIPYLMEIRQKYIIKRFRTRVNLIISCFLVSCLANSDLSNFLRITGSHTVLSLSVNT